MNAFMRRSLRLMLMASLGFFQTLVHTYAADAPTMLNCPGTRSDLSLDTGDWVILGDCEMGNVNLSGSAHLFFLPTTADQSKLVRSRVTLAGHTALKDSSAILFNSVDITFPQTFINEFWLEARDQSRVMVAQSTVLTMDKADAPTQSMFWRFFDNSELAVMGSSRLVNSWLMLSLFNRAFAIYEDSTNFFMEVYIPGDSPTTFIANRGSITKLWLPFTEAGTYTLVPDQDIAIVKPTMRVGITNMKYDIGVILQALNGTKPPAIRFRANSHFSLNLGLAGDQGGPVTLDGLKIHRRDSDEYLPAPFEKVLFEAGTYVDTIDVYVVSVRYPVTISNSIINEIGVDDRRGASYNPDPCNPCSEAIVDHSTIGWADSAATGSGHKRRVRLTIKDTDIWNQTIFAHEYGSIYISGASVIRGGAFVESTGSLNCAGECSWIDIAKTATITPNPACPGDRTTPEGVPLCQPLRNAGSLPTYTVCNGGVIHNGVDSGAQTVTCTNGGTF